MMQTTLWIAAGGAIGSVARYWISLLTMPLGRDLPWGTILINVGGSFAISFVGVMTMATGRYPVSDIWRMAFMVGVCGGFTTFSSFSLQTLELLRMGAPVRAMANVGLSVALCLVAVMIGYVAGERVNQALRPDAVVMFEDRTG